MTDTPSEKAAKAMNALNKAKDEELVDDSGEPTEGLPVDEYAIRSVVVQLRRPHDAADYEPYERIVSVPAGSALIVHEWVATDNERAEARITIVEQVA